LELLKLTYILKRKSVSAEKRQKWHKKPKTQKTKLPVKEY
jgi:hypothetical protein